MLKSLLNKYSKFWRADLIAALSVSFVAIPQVLAYASMAGLPPYLGLYASTIPTFIAAFLGTSKILSTGPVAVVSLLTASALSRIVVTDPSQLVLLAVVLAVFVGVIQVAFGLLKLGSFINFVAHPVMIGFTTAAAFIIGFSQVPKLLGVKIVDQEHFYQTVIEVIRNLSHLNTTTAMLGVGSLIFLLILKKIAPKVPGALFVIVGGMIVAKMLHYDGPIVGDIPRGFKLVDVSGVAALDFKPLFSSAMVIAIVGFMEGISVVKSLATQTRDKVNPNKEFIAQGFANISSGLIGSFPVAGSVSRTALNFASGAQTQLASMFLGIISLLALFLLAPLLYYLTYASLAAIIIVAVIGLVKVKEISELLRVRPRDGMVAVATLGSTLFFAPHLDSGIIVGIVASIIAHLHRSATPHVEVFFCHDKDYIHSHHYHLRTYPSNKKVMGVAIDSSLNFTNVSFIYEKIMSEVKKHKTKPKYVLLIASAINHIDSSAEQVLHEMHDELKEHDIQLLFAGLKSQVEESLKKTNLYEYLGGGNIYAETNMALSAINELEDGSNA